MAKTAVAAVVDEVLAATLTPSLKAMGFRKKARHWHHDDGGVYRGVTLQMRSMSTAEEAAFTIELGVSFDALGHPAVDTPMGAYVGTVRERVPILRSGWDHWYGFSAAHDPDPVGALIAEVGADWKEIAEPYLAAATDPRTMCEHALGGVLRSATSARSLARTLGDQTLERRLLRHELDLLRAEEIGTPADNEWRDEHLVREWRRRLPVANDLGVPLDAADVAAAAAVLQRLGRRDRPLSADDRQDAQLVIDALRQH